MYYDKQKVIDFEYSQIGYHEKASNSQLEDFTANAGDQNWNKYSAFLDTLKNFYNGPKNIGPLGMWCDTFQDASFVICYGREGAQYLLCQPDNSAGAGCQFSARYYNAKGRFHKTGPETGDQIFFGTSWDNIYHTGLVVKVSATHVWTIEGNSSDQVAERVHQINDNRIFGFGRPDWGTPPEGQEEAPESVPTPTNPAGSQEQSGTTQEAPGSENCKPDMPELKTGSKSGYVKCLQRQLIAMGYDCGGKKDRYGREVPDGEFGAKTKSAVMDRQGKAGLTQDGVVGEKTWPVVLNY